ncbi:hypothetical protein QQP08_009948 [Theobroma cacao]|nr:hypothetical protein QQP08_009948 [Theobroma cacao]
MGPQCLFSCAFYLSAWTSLIVIIGLPYSITMTFPSRNSSTAFIVARAFYIASIYISGVVAYSIPSAAYSKHEKLKHRVDTIRGRRVLACPGK